MYETVYDMYKYCYYSLLESIMVINLGAGSPMLELLDTTDTMKNSPDSNMASCTIVIVAQSVIPDVLVKVNDSLTGVKSRNAEEERRKGKEEREGGEGGRVIIIVYTCNSNSVCYGNTLSSASSC